MERTISFVKGKGSISHNNREFVTDNVDRDRIKDNIVYVQKELSIAYDEFFGEAVKEYDKKQKRKDRQYGSVKNYMTSLENSKNGEKLFYENIVQIGDMTDSGCGTPEGKVCAEILKENQGLSNEHRNKYQNSLLSWQKRERERLKEISKQHGIDTIELGIKRDDMELEVYKEHAKLITIKEELKEVTEKAEELKQQTDYYEERVASIDDIKYGVFAGKEAEKDNKALQYENKKLIDEKVKLLKENHELREAAGRWKLLYEGIMTYTDDKRKKAMEMINKFIIRGKDPLQAHIDDQKTHDDMDTNSSSIKHTLLKEYSEREERM